VSGYVRAKLGLYWRTWLTRDYLDQYLTGQTFYHIRAQNAIDNPDQRIEADVRTLTQQSLSLFEIIVESGFQLIGFAGLLWSISQPLMVTLLVYSMVGSAIAALCFGKPLVRINAEQLYREADFRYDLARIRENTEAIALYRGEAQELTQSWRQFGRVFNNFNRLIRWQLGLNLFQNHYRYATFIIPGIILAPRLFAGELEIGDVTQAGAAFTLTLSALALIVLQLQQLTSLGASIQRLQQLTAAFSAPGSSVTLSPLSTASDVSTNRLLSLPKISLRTGTSLAIENLSLMTPDGKKQLIRELSLAIPPGESLLIMGDSGVGKSSLMRAIAGLWQTGEGTIFRPQQLAFIPQRPYLPPGSLKNLLLYPESSFQADINEAQLRQALEQVNLPQLLLHPLEDAIAQPLSLGEQQRLAFARIFLYSPQYVILDEATSALDIANETWLYQQLQDKSVVPFSVGHRPSLQRHHQHLLTLFANGNWQLF
ncbi:MAG: ATP-binding cassette domain-containing protein, partial [Phormidesmis sp.]